MGSKKSFVVYTAWKSFFELLDDPVLVKELLFAVFSLAEGEEVVITNNKVRTAFNAIEPTMKEDLEAYKAKCEKNRAAAQSRWSNTDVMRSHADAMQRDGVTMSMIMVMTMIGCFCDDIIGLYKMFFGGLVCQ